MTAKIKLNLIELIIQRIFIHHIIQLPIAGIFDVFATWFNEGIQMRLTDANSREPFN